VASKSANRIFSARLELVPGWRTIRAGRFIAPGRQSMDHSIKSKLLKKYEAGLDVRHTQGENPPWISTLPSAR